MFKELYDRLTMTEQEKEDRKRFNALVKDFAKEFGLDEEKVSKSREVVYDVLYGGYNKKETTAFIRDSVLDSTYGQVSDIMSNVEDREMADSVTKGVKHFLNNDLQAIQQVNEVVYLAERAAYFDWYGKEKERDYYEERTTKSEKKLLDIACKNLLERVNEYDKTLQEKLAQQMGIGSNDGGTVQQIEDTEKTDIKRKGSLAKKPKNNKTVEASRGGMELGGI